MSEQVGESDETVAVDPPAPSAPASQPVARQQGRRIDYQHAAKVLVERCVRDAKGNQPRLDRDRADWQNLLMYRGGKENHWAVWDSATNSYVPRGTDPEQGGLPEWYPRASTNIFALKIDGICSLLNQSEPSKLWSPSTDDDADRATAEVAEDVDPVLLDEIDYDALRPELNKLAALTNGAALVLYYDNDEKHGMAGIPVMRCPSCEVYTTPMELDEAGGVCPPDMDDDGNVTGEGCGTSADDFEPVIESDGTPLELPYPKGKICATVVPSFEYSVPQSARAADAKRLPWILTHSGMTRGDIIGRWPKAEQLLEKTGTASKSGGIHRAYAKAMRQLSSPLRARQGGMGASTTDDTVVYILQHDPIDEEDLYFPDGLHAVMVDDQLVESGPLPVKDDEDRAIKTIILRSFSSAPGTAFGKPPADDLVPLQQQRNIVESLLLLILMHEAAPTTYIPLSVTLENPRTGRPGEDVYFRSTVPGEVPHTAQGVSPPDGLYKQLELIDQKFEEVSKLNAVLAGAKPDGDHTLGEVEILQERGMSAFKEPFDHLVRFERDLSRTLMFIAKQSAWSDRFRRVRGENGQWEISQFNAADLGGKVDVQIDKASAWPKSPYQRLLRLEKALGWGALPPPATDPELQTKILTELDLITMKPSLDADRKQVARELDRWKAAHDPAEIAPPDPLSQNLALHFHFKQQFLKTEEFEQLREANPPLAAAMVGHVQQIQMLMQQAQMAAAAAQNPAPPDGRTPADKGDGSAVEHAVKSGAIKPAGSVPQPPPANPLQDAIASGALMPAGAVPQPQLPQGPSIDELMEAGAIQPAPPDPSDTGGAHV